MIAAQDIREDHPQFAAARTRFSLTPTKLPPSSPFLSSTNRVPAACRWPARCVDQPEAKAKASTSAAFHCLRGIMAKSVKNNPKIHIKYAICRRAQIDYRRDFC